VDDIATLVDYDYVAHDLSIDRVLGSNPHDTVAAWGFRENSVDIVDVSVTETDQLLECFERLHCSSLQVPRQGLPGG
jgi:hypothetical protein